jgi:hypothetical protein
MQGDYEEYLEQRIPSFVKATPHWCTKGLTSFELEPLVNLVSEDERRFTARLYAHPSLSAALEQVPDELSAFLQFASASRLRDLAEQWANAMSVPERTHSGGGVRVQDDWSTEDALESLTPLAQLARQMQEEHSMYLLTEY